MLENYHTKKRKYIDLYCKGDLTMQELLLLTETAEKAEEKRLWRKMPFKRKCAAWAAILIVAALGGTQRW